ncbi:CoA pyrophosphatase [Blastomonas aquatica]|uniref:Coenzyme A pyrophosphatase n=1 Tax=Blastomonas aquatica TaxID=1510276 RepID=A0ABQ1JCA9_9SPHN|nr:CoA pyrophosphatase [Blastomonas aquatica]GGB63100.1 coenzyme A pyrophosphatase [Blastomonas aquatica]
MSLFDRLAYALAASAGGDFAGEDERHIDPDGGRHIDAAVLIAVTDRPEPGVILTQRPDYLRSHPGQIAFPGGKIDPTDTDAIAAALREADEELGLAPSYVRVIGTADIYRSGSGFAITPVLAVIPPDLSYTPNPGEVADWFEVPLGFVLDRANHVQHSTRWKGAERRYIEIMWGRRRIWGVTAGIIANLSRRLEGVSA